MCAHSLPRFPCTDFRFGWSRMAARNLMSVSRGRERRESCLEPWHMNREGTIPVLQSGIHNSFPPKTWRQSYIQILKQKKPAGKRCQVELDYIMPLEAWSKMCLAFMLASQYFRRNSDMVNNTRVPRKFRRQTWRVPHFVFWWHIYTIPDQQIFVISRTKFLVENQTHNQKFQSTPCPRK